jgi:NTE family protein
MASEPDRTVRSGQGSSGARKIGLALGSGSARGLAHIGVVRAIQEAGLEISAVAGTSMGAVVGASFAAGGINELRDKFLEFDWKRVVSLLDPVFPRSGLIDGQKIADFVRTQVPASRIEDLAIPFAAVAVDLTSGKEVVARTGDLVEAVRASIAVPGILTPVRADGGILVDGGLINPVPVSVARAMGADLVIGVDLNHDIAASRLGRPAQRFAASARRQPFERFLATLRAFDNPAFAQLDKWLQREPLPGILDVLLGSIYIMQAQITEARLARDPPEILVQPPLGGVRFLEFDRAAEIIEIGYRSTLEQLEALF